MNLLILPTCILTKNYNTTIDMNSKSALDMRNRLIFAHVLTHFFIKDGDNVLRRSRNV